MPIARAALLSLAGLASLAGCTSIEPEPRARVPGAIVRCDACVPSFSSDGRVRRDLETGAPLFVASAGSLEARAPRFNPDGTVARDPETGAPIYEEVSAGEVVRVLVATP